MVEHQKKVMISNVVCFGPFAHAYWHLLYLFLFDMSVGMLYSTRVELYASTTYCRMSIYYFIKSIYLKHLS